LARAFILSTAALADEFSSLGSELPATRATWSVVAVAVVEGVSAPARDLAICAGALGARDGPGCCCNASARSAALDGAAARFRALAGIPTFLFEAFPRPARPVSARASAEAAGCAAGRDCAWDSATAGLSTLAGEAAMRAVCSTRCGRAVALFWGVTLGTSEVRAAAIARLAATVGLLPATLGDGWSLAAAAGPVACRASWLLAGPGALRFVSAGALATDSIVAAALLVTVAALVRRLGLSAVDCESVGVELLVCCRGEISAWASERELSNTGDARSRVTCGPPAGLRSSSTLPAANWRGCSEATAWLLLSAGWAAGEAVT